MLVSMSNRQTPNFNNFSVKTFQPSFAMAFPEPSNRAADVLLPMVKRFSARKQSKITGLIKKMQVSQASHKHNDVELGFSCNLHHKSGCPVYVGLRAEVKDKEGQSVSRIIIKPSENDFLNYWKLKIALIKTEKRANKHEKNLIHKISDMFDEKTNS